MARETLTARRVHAMKPPKAGRIETFDTVIPGLCYRVTDKGARSWSLMYRVAGKLRRDTLGAYPGIGLADARQKAREALELLGQSKDPREIAAAQKAVADQQRADTVATVVERFNTLYAAERKWAELQSILRSEIVEAWGSRPISSVTRKDALTLLSRIKERAPVRANRVLTVLKLFFGWALENGFVSDSPVAAIKKPTREVRRNRVLTELEIRAFWKAAEGLGWPHGPLVRLLLLTAARRDELSRLRWREVNDKERYIEIAAERVKGGSPHVIPMSLTARDILKQLPRIGESPNYVFTRGGQKPVTDFSKTKIALDRLMLEALREDVQGTAEKPDEVTLENWTLHDLRRTARTEMSRIGILPDIAERVLGHAIGGVRGIYDRFEYRDEKRHALERWAAHLDTIISPPAGPKVVRLGRKRSAFGGNGP